MEIFKKYKQPEVKFYAKRLLYEKVGGMATFKDRAPPRTYRESFGRKWGAAKRAGGEAWQGTKITYQKRLGKKEDAAGK